MTDNMFDKFVRDKLADHQSPVPPGLWEKIERKKDKDPKGGFFLPRVAIWAGAVIIAAGIGIGYYVSRNDSPSTAAGTVQEHTVAAKDNGGSSNTGQSINPTTTQRDNNTSLTENDNTASTNNNTGHSPRSIIPGAATNDAVSDNTGNTLKRDQAISKTGTARNSNTTTNDRELVTDNAGVTSGYNSTKQNGSYVISQAGKSRAKTNKKTVKDPVLSQPGSRSITADYLSKMDEALHRVLLTPGKTAYNLRSLAGFGRNNYNLSELKIIGIDCPPRGDERRNDWYLEVFGSPDIVMKSVKSSNTSLTSKKDSTESQQLSYTAGFRISKSIGENLLVKTGLQYSQINERFDLRTENERRIITVVTIRTVIGSNGADSTVSDTSTVEQIGYRLQRSYNRYRSIDIPILLSYEFGNENLKFAVNAGAIINLRSWYKGTTINDSLAPVSMSSKNSGVYKQNIGIGLYAGFSIIKPISNKFDLFAEPYFRYNFTNMSRSAGYSQRFNAMGINLGIRYKLKGRQRSEMN